MAVGIAEFLEKVGKLKTNQEKAEALRVNDHVAMRTVLQGIFDPGIEFELPPGEPPYKPNTLVDQQSVLFREARKIQYFVKGVYPGLKQIKREQMFIEMLENVDPLDAKMLVSMKDKKLFCKGITIQNVKEGLPGLIKDEQE